MLYFLQASVFFDIDWQSFLLGDEKWHFLVEAALRSFVMFTVILFSLRILGKRSITQLSVFELGVIIGLGSAAGDPMFYKDVGLLPGVVVFIVVISLYRLVTYLLDKSDRLEQILEGQPRYVVKDGKFIIENFQKEPIGHDEFMSQLRIQSVSHLGQVQTVIIETNGTFSIYFYPDEDVKHGLPILPHLYNQKTDQIDEEDIYACAHCGQTEELIPSSDHVCKVCSKNQWVKAIKVVRIR